MCYIVPRVSSKFDPQYWLTDIQRFAATQQVWCIAYHTRDWLRLWSHVFAAFNGYESDDEGRDKAFCLPDWLDYLKAERLITHRERKQLLHADEFLSAIVIRQYNATGERFDELVRVVRLVRHITREREE